MRLRLTGQKIHAVCGLVLLIFCFFLSPVFHCPCADVRGSAESTEMCALRLEHGASLLELFNAKLECDSQAAE